MNRRDVTVTALLAALYFAAGKLGLSLDPVGGFATLVWPPAGIAVTASLLYGLRIWPGIAVAALLVNVATGAPILVAAGIAVGNTLEAVIATHLLRRYAKFDVALPRVKDVLALVTLGAGISAMVAATIGVSSLVAGGVVESAGFRAAWIAWWLGDVMGILTVTPLILMWVIRLRRPAALNRAALAEALLLGIVLAIASWTIFATGRTGSATAFWQAYVLAPLLMWAALRFQQLGAVTAIFVVSCIAIWGTALGLGPFTATELHMRLEHLQVFLAVTTVTFLVLGVLASERKTVERELIEAKEEAEEASHAKSQFLAVTSHELRTPLTAIVGYVDLLETGVGGTLSEKQSVQVARIKAAAWHLVAIIESILSFSRVEAGREEIWLEQVDASAVARNAIAMIEPTANEKGLVLAAQLPETALPLRTDTAKLNQILLNLLGNAVKFADSGTISFAVARGNGTIEFRVSDEGPGIPAEAVSRIFEPFTQVDQSTTRAKGGTGLGLSVARMFADMLGGTISVQSTLGRGSVFTLRLPAHEDSTV
ncbi:MAG: MASE1 domain-containing protein [Gemmatimonadota bacterium]